ncbi:DNA-directed RNA polymerase III subunit RPC5-like [Antedon mediterranea]|uniref:DNA-directed RNA polymerase III subunit RPC5-like n=1 Tax=Antedon mediterranea TaxID=105859 RepID=UPI003AF81461
MDEDDPVVEEVDVFLTKSLAESLYLFQYPVRPASMPDDLEHELVRIKPKQQKIEMELALDTTDKHFSRSKGEQIARNVDGAFPGETSVFKNGVMNRHFLTSSQAVMSSEIHRYAVGIIQEGELHLTPLHGIVQLRPSFKYLDKADNRLKQEKLDMEGESSQEEEESKPKAVTVRYIRAETEESKARREASYQYIEEKRAQEAWTTVEYQTSDSKESATDRNELLCQTEGQEVSQLYLSHRDYLSTLLSQPEKQSNNEELSLVQLQELGLADQVRLLLVNAKLLRFSDLQRFLHGSPDSTSVIKTLQTVAVLVQGCWVVKSEVLYPKDTTSPLTGIAADILCRGRDYMLWRFTQNSIVVRKELAGVIKLPDDDVKEILSQVSKPVTRLGWEFAYIKDEHFINSNPDVVQRQRMLWDAKLQQLQKVLKFSKDADKKKSKESQGNRSRSRTKSQSKSEPMEVSSRVNTQKTTKIKTESQEKTDIANTSTVNTAEKNTAVENTTEKNTAAENTAAESTATENNSTESTATDAEAQQIKLQNFIRKKLLVNSVLSLNDLKKMAQLKVAECSPGEMTSSLSDYQVEQCAIQGGAIQMKVAWPPNSKGNCKLFTIRSIGNDLDIFREVLIDMFAVQFKYRKNSIAEKFKEILGEEPSTKAELDKVVKSLCVHRGQFWYLKGTVPS